MEEISLINLKNKSLTERDQSVIWHPYTQHKNMIPPIPIVRGEGAVLFDENNRSYIDAVSSWWVNIHGHGHPYIARKIYEQADRLAQVIFTGFTHEPAVALAERLLEKLPGELSKIFYSDNGSTAVEVALKMAVQYWKNSQGDASTELVDSKPIPARNKILAFKNSYHGDTFGAMSVSQRSVFTRCFEEFLFEVIFIDTPSSGNIADLKELILQQGHEMACFIYEPLLQGAGGMLMHEPEWLDELLGAVKQSGILCIADEVLTGFGRTGKLFACQYLEHQPDIICLSKGLTGGTMALGVTAASERIFLRFSSEDRTRTFFHGHSFTANPIACAASLASLDLLEDPQCMENIKRIERSHAQFASQLAGLPSKLQTRNIRQLGTILAFEIDAGEYSYLNARGPAITRMALREGIYLRPLGNTVYLMPPYCTTPAQLSQVYQFLTNLITGGMEQL